VYAGRQLFHVYAVERIGELSECGSDLTRECDECVFESHSRSVAMRGASVRERRLTVQSREALAKGRDGGPQRSFVVEGKREP